VFFLFVAVVSFVLTVLQEKKEIIIAKEQAACFVARIFRSGTLSLFCCWNESYGYRE